MSILELLQHIVNEPAPRLPEGRYPREADDFVEKCLFKDPEERWTPKTLLVRFIIWITQTFINFTTGTPLAHPRSGLRLRSRGLGKHILRTVSSCRFLSSALGSPWLHHCMHIIYIAPVYCKNPFVLPRRRACKK